MTDDATPFSVPDGLPDAVLRYAPHDDGLVDVHLPPLASAGSEPRTLVFFVHGGFWRQATDRTHARPLADALAALEFVVAVPEYRRVGGAGGWPATGDDVELALSVTPRMLAEIGVLVSGTVVVGHSAGGHLALWLATRPAAADVSRVVALAPVGDLRQAARERLGNGAAVDLLGGTPDEVPAAYAAADPGTLLTARPACEVVVVHGDRDEPVPIQNTRGLQARHPWIDLRELPDVGHMDVIDPVSRAWTSVVEAVLG